MNDWNFLVREVGRERGVQERSLEIAEVLRGGGRRYVMETGSRVAHALEKGTGKFITSVY